MNALKAAFIERHISTLSHVPPEWSVTPGFFYQLNLKMCQISSLEYDFKWGHTSHGKHSVLDKPRKILLLDVSLNDISSLDHHHLAPFTELRVLNASLNRIERYAGIENLKLLLFLDLSNNNISQLQGLHGCITLKMLNLSMNYLEDISNMPSLVQLRELHLSNNKLKSLDGIQALPSLQELHVQRNLLTDLIPLATSFRLSILNAADNQITSLKDTVEVLQDLQKLQSLILQGNPIDQEPLYQSRLVSATGIAILDNVTVRSQPKPQAVFSQNLDTLKEATREAFMKHIAQKRVAMEESVRFLHKRIQTVQDDFRDYETSALSDLESCLRYMDTLSLDDAQRYSSQFLKDRVPLGPALPVVRNQHQYHRKATSLDSSHYPGGSTSPSESKHSKHNYKDVKDTDEVLRCVYNELARNHDGFQLHD